MPRFDTYQQKVLALAGMFTAAELVHAVAHTGSCDDTVATTLIQSIFDLHPRSFETIYPEPVKNLKLGLQSLIELLEATQALKNTAIPNYVLGLIVLEKNYVKNPASLNF